MTEKIPGISVLTKDHRQIAMRAADAIGAAVRGDGEVRSMRAVWLAGAHEEAATSSVGCRKDCPLAVRQRYDRR
jgi:hypothetical protein